MTTFTEMKKKFGKELKTFRQKNGYTQFTIAKRLGLSSAQFISNFERGASLPPAPMVGALTRILKKSNSLPKLYAATHAARLFERMKKPYKNLRAGKRKTKVRMKK